MRETHAVDEWKYDKYIYNIKKHKCLEDRLTAARLLAKKDFSCPIVVDPMTNENMKSYGSLPERLYVIKDGSIIYQGGSGPTNYRVSDLVKWLEKYEADNKCL